MKSIVLRLGTVLLVIVLIAAAVVLVRLGMAALQVAQADTPERSAALSQLASTESLTILPLYEEAAGDSGYLWGHGVSYLVRTDETTILMDLGHNPNHASPAPIVTNMEQAGIVPDEVDLLFISHNHPDHVGGLQWRSTDFYTASGQSILDVEAAYLPSALAFAGAESHVAEEPQVIAPGVATLGRMPFVQPFPFWLWEPLAYEQVLAVSVADKGLVLITGCGHPTLETIVARAEALFDEPVVGVVGGLHYEGVSNEEIAEHVAFLAARNPQLVALSPHDDGPNAIEAFRQAFPDAYRFIQVGQVIEFGAPAIAGMQTDS